MVIQILVVDDDCVVYGICHFVRKPKYLEQKAWKRPYRFYRYLWMVDLVVSSTYFHLLVKWSRLSLRPAFLWGLTVGHIIHTHAYQKGCLLLAYYCCFLLTHYVHYSPPAYLWLTAYTKISCKLVNDNARGEILFLWPLSSNLGNNYPWDATRVEIITLHKKDLLLP